MTSTNKSVGLVLTSVATAGLALGTAFAQAPPKPATLGLIVYPASGQDAAQQGKDEGECYTWARQQTGIDPYGRSHSRSRSRRAEGRARSRALPRGREGGRRRCRRRGRLQA
jgi:hypothetical protein